ncbi:MAG: gluconate 2-dehydrogenase subunit 3 family protein [Deltaproteobacteria bacterium]|nr:gluconate 2-dehydrogenase subunit 3 family protein [Deltaproteobacteria bacterium]
MDRRAFLQRGLVGGAILAASACTLHAWPVQDRYQPQGNLQCLDPRTFVVLASIAARTVQDPVADPVAIAHAVDRTIALSAPEAASELRQLLNLFESGLAGLLLDGRLRPFTRLTPDRQDQVLAAWRDSRLVLRRAGYTALRKLTLAAHYASPTTWEGVGYPGPPELVEG